MKNLSDKDLPELPQITKKLINTGNFRLYEIEKNKYLLVMDETDDYYLLDLKGKVIDTINRDKKPRVRVSDSVKFSDLPSAPSLNDLVSACV